MTPLRTKTLTLYDEEPYFTNSLNSMEKKNWVLLYTRRYKKEFSHKTLVECIFYKKNVSHWKSEYEVDYCISSICDGKTVSKNYLWIVEASSSDEAKSIAIQHFSNVSGFSIQDIKKVWSY